MKSQSSASQASASSVDEEGKEGEANTGPTPPVPGAEQSYEEKEVKKTRSKEILFKFEHHGFGAKQIEDFTNLEDDMCKFDNAVLEVKIMKNHLETYVYDMRAALDTIGNMKEFIKEDTRNAFLQELNETEQWIYDDGESAAKNVYQDKLSHLQLIGDPVKMRFKFHEAYPSKLKEFQDILANIYQNAVDIPDESHITQEEKETLIKQWEENTNWISTSVSVQSTLPLHEDPAIDLTELEQRKYALQDLATKTLNKPAPKQEEPKKEDEKSGEEINKDSEMKNS